MVKVFISHSSKDIDLVNKIERALRPIGIEPLFAEFEPDVSPPYKKIYDMMINSSAVFLFLTPNVKFSDYTQNWISYEVGLAHGTGKEVYVFEKAGSYIKFPVPYLTD